MASVLGSESKPIAFISKWLPARGKPGTTESSTRRASSRQHDRVIPHPGTAPTVFESRQSPKTATGRTRPSGNGRRRQSGCCRDRPVPRGNSSRIGARAKRRSFATNGARLKGGLDIVPPTSSSKGDPSSCMATYSSLVKSTPSSCARYTHVQHCCRVIRQPRRMRHSSFCGSH